MSWKASAWAKDQRLGSPAAKSILMCLADYADPDGLIRGWASQSRLADDAEVSERTAREWLQRLEEWGLIERRRCSRSNGARAADHIQLSLRTKVSDGAEKCRRAKDGEADSDAHLPANSAGRPNRQPDADLPATDDHPTGSQFRAYKEEPPIPPNPSQSAPERAREPENPDSGRQASDRMPSDVRRPAGAPAAREAEEYDPKRVEAEGWKLLKDWPGFAGMPKEPALKAWRALSPGDRAEAVRKFPHWLALLKAQGKSHVPAPATYFRERLFDDVPEPEPDTPTVVEARVFGPVWNGVCIRELLKPPQPSPPPHSPFIARLVEQDDEAGRAERLRRQAQHGWPKVRGWYEQAESRKGFSVPIADEALADLMEAVPVGSQVHAAWRAEYERRGWPWIPDHSGMRVVWFPKGGPAGLEEFQNALTASGPDGPASAGASERSDGSRPRPAAEDADSAEGGKADRPSGTFARPAGGTGGEAADASREANANAGRYT